MQWQREGEFHSDQLGAPSPGHLPLPAPAAQASRSCLQGGSAPPQHCRENNHAWVEAAGAWRTAASDCGVHLPAPSPPNRFLTSCFAKSGPSARPGAGFGAVVLDVEPDFVTVQNHRQKGQFIPSGQCQLLLHESTTEGLLFLARTQWRFTHRARGMLDPGPDSHSQIHSDHGNPAARCPAPTPHSSYTS